MKTSIKAFVYIFKCISVYEKPLSPDKEIFTLCNQIKLRQAVGKLQTKAGFALYRFTYRVKRLMDLSF